MTSNEAKDLFVAGIIIGLALASLIFIVGISIRNALARHHRRMHYVDGYTPRI